MPVTVPQDQLDSKYDPYYETPPVVEIDELEQKRGHAGYLDEMQKAQVFQLRSMLEAEGCNPKLLDTLTLLRFLRARKFDVNLSKQMFVEYTEWRKKTMLDDLVPTWDYTEGKAMSQYYPQYYHKTDKDGRPLYIEAFGKIDLAAMRKITTDERMLDNLAVEYERCAGDRFHACSAKHGHLVETCCTIMDLYGVGIMSAYQVYDYVQRASVISQNYYPERLGKLYMINAPMGFSSVWAVVKRWLDPVTVKKISILGSGYKKELLAQIPAENLPEKFGGTCRCASTDPQFASYNPKDPYAPGPCQFSDAGPWRDESWTSKPENKPWYENEEVKQKAAEALKGTPKDPALQYKTAEPAAA